MAPCMAPSDFWWFSKLKETLKDQRFPTDAEGQDALSKWIRSQSHSFYMDGMRQIERLNKCVAVSDDYVEK
ncbi:hypothetical protein TNCV_5116681 [Trichonephila clavipes]|nr:hypothetical protein TNCV_5116681 [Trichonephila clavipes]